MHENFDSETFLNDIALIRVTRPIPFNERINGICLPQSGKIASGIVTAAGWGALAEGIFIIKYLVEGLFNHLSTSFRG